VRAVRAVVRRILVCGKQTRRSAWWGGQSKGISERPASVIERLLPDGAGSAQGCRLNRRLHGRQSAFDNGVRDRVDKLEAQRRVASQEKISAFWYVVHR
jgi:hypothetical protein